MEKAMIMNMIEKTGRSLENWLIVVSKQEVKKHSEIVNFAKQCEAETVVVYHTDPNHARPPLVEELESNGHIVHTPINGQSTIIS